MGLFEKLFWKYHIESLEDYACPYRRNNTYDWKDTKPRCAAQNVNPDAIPERISWWGCASYCNTKDYAEKCRRYKERKSEPPSRMYTTEYRYVREKNGIWKKYHAGPFEGTTVRLTEEEVEAKGGFPYLPYWWVGTDFEESERQKSQEGGNR